MYIICHYMSPSLYVLLPGGVLSLDSFIKTAVLVSGGVDSAVALHKLAQSGRPVTAFYLKIWLEDELVHLGTCPWEEDLQYVRAICDKLGVPLEVISLQKPYWDQVVAYTIAEVRAGRTPNPDVLCNSRIKFGVFMAAIDPSYARIASGHYARAERTDDGVKLCVTPDPIKDQTYFLSQLTPTQLAKLEFPLGSMTKQEVRAYAHAHDLPNKDRKDSQGICFLGNFKFRDFIAHHVGIKKGSLIEWETGTKLGEHDGFWFYTIGQRQGIRLGGGPWYVMQKDTARNIVYISRTYYAADKMRDQFLVSQCSWLATPPADGERLKLKMRHGPHYHDALVTHRGDGTLHIQLAMHDQGIAAGQFAVFYRGDVCVGSGVIALCS